MLHLEIILDIKLNYLQTDRKIESDSTFHVFDEHSWCVCKIKLQIIIQILRQCIMECVAYV